MQNCPALLDAYRNRAICMVNSFRSKLIHKKPCCRFDGWRKTLFPNQAWRYQAHVPWTRLSGMNQLLRSNVNLLEFVLASRNKLVLKPSDDYAAMESLSAGTQTRQAGTIRECVKYGDYLVQERATARESFRP